MKRLIWGCMLCALMASGAVQANQPFVPPEDTAFGLQYVPAEAPSLAPPVAFKTEDGRDTGLIEMRGQVLLVNFWATWCPPCVAEMPAFDRLAADYGAQGFKIVALSQDTNPGVIRPFYERLGLKNFDIYVDEGRIFAAVMAIPGLPATFVVDREGRVVGAIAGATDWDSPDARALIEHYLAMPGAS